jgi:Protein of unknown function (DUF3592)
MNQNNIILAISITFLAVVAVLWVLKRMKLRRARAWPTVAGQVDSTTLNMQTTGNNQKAWVAVVTYSYAVEGATYTGGLRRQFLLKNSADKWIGRYKNGLPLTVRYDPSKAKDSVLFEKEQSGVGAA